MSRPLRNRDPDIFRLITIRTEESRLWMIPSRNLEKLLLGILARYQEIFAVTIYAYCILSNHIHMVIKTSGGNVDEFMENVAREVARRVNWKNRRQGKFWARRYDDQEVVSEEDLLESFLYVTLNHVRHGLEKDPSRWGLLSSYQQVLDEKVRMYSFYHYSAGEEEERVTRHKLIITPLPQFESLPKEQRYTAMQKLLSERVQSIITNREESTLGFLGIETVKSQIPGIVPMKTSRSPRPPCYTNSSALRRQYRKDYRIRLNHYKEASARYRLGDATADFPSYSFKPPLHRKPRHSPFKPLPDNYFQFAA